MRFIAIVLSFILLLPALATATEPLEIMSRSKSINKNFLPALTTATEPLPAVPPIPEDNTMTEAKVELGKMLFFDPRLSSSGVVSCATCHNPSFAFTDRVERALGHNHQVGPRNTPTALNSAFLGSQFWDGRAATLEEQALGPIQASVEMNETLPNVVAHLKEIPGYRLMFADVFGGKDPVTPENIAKAIAAFERTLVTTNSPFDRFLMGDRDAISPAARKGWELFQQKGCVACHSGPNFTNSQFYRIQVPGSTDLGRFQVTKDEDDKYKFRVQGLRNVALTYPFFVKGNLINARFCCHCGERSEEAIFMDLICLKTRLLHVVRNDELKD